MITIRNKRQHDVGIQTIKDRAAHLVQALENCPLEFILAALIVFDKYNSPGTKSPTPRRWVRQFCGLESDASHKGMEAIIEVLVDGKVVHDRVTLIKLMKEMPDIA